MNGGDGSFSREEILAGGLDHRPGRVLAAIESRCVHLIAESRRALEAYLLNEQPEFKRQYDLSFFKEMKLLTQPVVLRLEELEKLGRYWAPLLPEDWLLRVDILLLMAQKYSFNWENTVSIHQAFDIERLEFQTAFEERTGKTLAGFFDRTNEEQIPYLPKVEPENNLSEHDQVLAEASASLEWVLLPAGRTLYQKGDPGDSLYILISGRLQAMAPAENGEPHFLHEWGRGEVVGEMEALTGEPRTADVIAIRDCELVRLNREDVDRLAQKFPRVLLRINRILAERLRARMVGEDPAGRKARSNTVATFALLPVTAGVPLEELARRFAEELALYGRVLYLNSDVLDELLGAGAAQTPANGFENSRLSAWLSEQEERYQYIVYQTDEKPSEWTDRCIRQSDRVLMVVNTQAQMVRREFERRIDASKSTSQVELVLLQPDSTTRPRDTRKWLQKVEAKAFYHLRLGEPEDMGRLVRRLTARALGLVLGGGGARGFAHIGVYRAFQEEGFKIDLLGGTSMGAILGAGFAMGLTYEELTDISRELAPPWKLFDPTLPVVSFFSSGKVSSALQEIFGDTQIEDLWRPFFCVSTNLTRAVTVMHTQGTLWKAVRASSAIPGVFSPVLIDDQLLVDGAVLNNLPIDVMKEFSQGGPIAAVNVFPEVDLDKEYNFGTEISGWQALLSKVNPLSRDMLAPSIFENLLRVIALNDVHQARAKKELADLYIRPPVERYNILDFRRYAPIIQMGYQAGQQAIQAWKAEPGDSRLADSLPPRPTQHWLRTLEDIGQTLDELYV